jgi:Fe-S cluster biogenesis protein NfuA
MLTYAQTQPATRGTKDSLNGDAVEDYLREKETPMLVEDGGMCPVPLQGMEQGLNATFNSHGSTAPAPGGQ